MYIVILHFLSKDPRHLERQYRVLSMFCRGLFSPSFFSLPSSSFPHCPRSSLRNQWGGINANVVWFSLPGIFRFFFLSHSPSSRSFSSRCWLVPGSCFLVGCHSSVFVLIHLPPTIHTPTLRVILTLLIHSPSRSRNAFCSKPPDMFRVTSPRAQQYGSQSKFV